MDGRIPTTHVGSLPRPKDVSDMLFAREAGQDVDPAAFDAAVAAAVTEVVAKQRAAGVDVPSDGEMSKISYATYIGERLTGFSGDSERRVPADLLHGAQLCQAPGLGRRHAQLQASLLHGGDQGAHDGAVAGRHHPLPGGAGRQRAMPRAS